jgi:carboxylesterase
MTHPSAEPFLLPGGSTGCLLLHGFAGMPAEIRGLGDYLAAQGYTVLGVRLAGHGDTPEALLGVPWRDWLHSAEAGIAQLRKHCDQIVVVGFSLGGALAIMLAPHYAFTRLVLLATPLMLQGDWRLNLLPLAKYVIPWFYPLKEADLSDPFIQQRIREFAPDADLSDPSVCEAIREQVRIPVAALHELQKALRHARAGVSHVQQPTLIMHGREDDIAPPQSADELNRRLGSAEKKLVWWDQTGHQMLVVGPHREAIYQHIAEFIASPSAPAP